jgi:uncharacterized RDD family membrane protein YckC
LAGDFHSGPLSVVIPFGIWGVITLFWFWAMGFRVMVRNYRYGDPSLRHLNVFLLASFVSKIIGFLFIFGSLPDDIGPCAMFIGLSIAFNHGVMGPRVAPRVNPAPSRAGIPFGAQPAWPR